jgi:hypothetical protein
MASSSGRVAGDPASLASEDSAYPGEVATGSLAALRASQRAAPNKEVQSVFRFRRNGMRSRRLLKKPGCHSGARRRREPGIQECRKIPCFWIPGLPPSKSAVADLDNIDADLA